MRQDRTGEVVQPVEFVLRAAEVMQELLLGLTPLGVPWRQAFSGCGMDTDWDRAEGRQGDQ